MENLGNLGIWTSCVPNDSCLHILKNYQWCKGKLGFVNVLSKLARTACSGIWSRIPPLPHENSNLVRSCHFEFWLLQNTHPPPLLLQTGLQLTLSTFQDSSDGKAWDCKHRKLEYGVCGDVETNRCMLEYGVCGDVETNRCIPKGYLLVLSIDYRVVVFDTRWNV